MVVSSHKLAALLARRLGDVLPTPQFRLVANGAAIQGFSDDAWEGTVEIEQIVDDETRDLAERLETAAYSVLSSVQDLVSKRLRSPWPSDLRGQMAIAAVRVDQKAIHLWFGRDEAAPILKIAPVMIAECMH